MEILILDQSNIPYCAQIPTKMFDPLSVVIPDPVEL